MPEYVTCTAQKVFPDGDYPFRVNDAQLKTAESGNEMIEMELIVSDKNGEGITVIDRLVFTEKAYWKIDQFRVATGENLTNDQKVMFEAEDCIDREGWLTLGIDQYEGRRKNVVLGYIDPALLDPQVRAAGSKPAHSAAGVQKELKDDLNFGTIPAGS
jgi:hypothetical protein